MEKFIKIPVLSSEKTPTPFKLAPLPLKIKILLLFADFEENHYLHSCTKGEGVGTMRSNYFLHKKHMKQSLKVTEAYFIA